MESIRFADPARWTIEDGKLVVLFGRGEEQLVCRIDHEFITDNIVESKGTDARGIPNWLEAARQHHKEIEQEISERLSSGFGLGSDGTLWIRAGSWKP